MHLSCRRFLSLSLVRFIACFCACSSACSASITVAQAEQILVVSGEKVPDALYDAVSDAFGDMGSVLSPSGYNAKARARSQEPDSEQALTKLAPQAGASLIVVLQQARNKVKVEFRSGYTGAVVGHTSVPARGKQPKLAKSARKRLLAAAKRAHRKIGPAPSKRASSDDDLADEPALQRANTTSKPQPSQPSRPAAALEQTEPDEEEQAAYGESEDAADEAPPRKAPAALEDAGNMFRLHAGIGLGTRAIIVPTAPGRALGLGNRVDTSFAPSLDIGAALELGLGPKWLLRFSADYRTILGLLAGYLTSTNTMATSSLSSHSIIAGASLGHLSDGRDSFGVHVFLGWAWRRLSAAEPSLPSAGISGLVLRPEIEIPIANLKLALRVAPELILIVAPSATLPANDNGLTGAIGFALGGEISLDLHISKTVGLSAQFRESRGSTPSGFGTTAIENERYIALRLLLQF